MGFWVTLNRKRIFVPDRQTRRPGLANNDVIRVISTLLLIRGSESTSVPVGSRDRQQLAKGARWADEPTAEAAHEAAHLGN